MVSLIAVFLLVLLSTLGQAAGIEDAVPCQRTSWRRVPNQSFGEHETFSFGVAWSFIKAGTAVLAVEGVEPIQGRPAYHLSMEIRTRGVANTLHPYHDRTDSWLDRDSVTTLRSHQVVRQKRYFRDETVEFDPLCRRFQKKGKRDEKGRPEFRRGRMSANAVDVYGALFYLRTLPLALGRSYGLEFFIGDRTIPVTAVVRRKERLKVPAGKFDCFLIELSTRDASAARKVRRIQWWLSTDARHLPVRIRSEAPIGHLSADLASFR